MAGDCGSICPVPVGFYNDRPNIGANGALVGLFGALVPLCLYYGLRYRPIVFSGILSTGCLLSGLGFLGRILLNTNPTSQGYFLLSLLGTVLGPVFSTVAAFGALPHILNVYGEQLSPISPWLVAIALYSTALVAGLLQVIGACLGAFPRGVEQRRNATKLVAGGLGVQLVALLGFSAIHAWFRIGLGARRMEMDPKHSALYNSSRFRRFLLSIQLAVLLLTGYSTYRIVEMAQGIAGPLFQNQYVTCFLDGVVVWIAALLMLLPHPGYTFRAAWGPTSPFGTRRQQQQRRRMPPTPLRPMQDRPEGYKAHARYEPNIRAQISPTSQRSPRAPEPPAGSPGLPSHPKAALKASPMPSPTGTANTAGTIENRTSWRTERRNTVPPKKLVEDDVLW